MSIIKFDDIEEIKKKATINDAKQYALSQISLEALLNILRELHAITIYNHFCKVSGEDMARLLNTEDREALKQIIEVVCDYLINVSKQIDKAPIETEDKLDLESYYLSTNIENSHIGKVAEIYKNIL